MNALYCMQSNLGGKPHGRDSQYRDKIEDSIDELKNIAMLVVGDREAQGTPVVRVDDNKLTISWPA